MKDILLYSNGIQALEPKTAAFLLINPLLNYMVMVLACKEI